MPLDHLVISNMKTGYETDRTPFNIDNDAFPILENAYIWRGRLLRKRGTSLLGRLRRDLVLFAEPNPDGSALYHQDLLNGLRTPEPNAQLVPNTIEFILDNGLGNQTIYHDNGLGNVTLTSGVFTISSGSINYATGYLTLNFTGIPGAGIPAVATFSYYPDLPVMGLEDFDIGLVNQPLLISFDTRYSYGFNEGTNQFYDVTFYKSTGLPFNWNGQDYQQFYSTNYLGVNTIADKPDKTGCLWVTNGDPGFQFITITNVTVANAGMVNAISTVTTSAAHNLANTDYVFINEVNGIISSGAPAGTFGGINGASGLVTVTGATTFTLPTPYTGGAYVSGGIVQYMTRNPSGTGDGIRWYDGDPNVSHNFGWVNFAPPLNQYDATLNPHPFYLVGADIITPFKNRLIFSGVYLTTTINAAPIQYFPNRIVYSQVGTPFYAQPLPFPISTQAPDPTAWFQNVAGKGGFLTAPVDQEIITVADNEDVLIYGMENKQLKLIYTFDDSLPFIFQTINSELGSQNTFSAVILDTGVLSIGDYGIVMTTQTSAQRIDLRIPDQVFDISVSNNNNYRVTARRDYRNEWIYFTYCPGEKEINVGVSNNYSKKYPNRTLLYNYRDDNWATFEENYTHYGTFRRTTRETWASIGSIYPTWADWTVPWNFGANEAFFPAILGGNQHGFVLDRSQETTNEAFSQIITAVDITTMRITSPNHCLSNGDFIRITSLLGISFLDILGNPLPTTIFKVTVIDPDTLQLNYTQSFTMVGTYLGTGIYKRYSRPFIQSKQFPIYWEGGRGCRVGTQRYLLQNSGAINPLTGFGGQISALIYSSQNVDTPSNDPAINPYLTFQNIVFTTPEPDLYGADPAYSDGQQQIWHRQSNSFNGDTIQFGFTLSDEQMFNPDMNTREIILHSIVLDLYPGATLA